MNNKDTRVKKAEKIKLKSIKEMDDFYKKHWIKSNEIITLILKNHLYIENCLDQIFKLVLPHPKKIVDKRFVDKIDIFEALELYPNIEIVNKLRCINRLRNKFAHNLNYKLISNDLEALIQGLKNVSNKTNLNKLKIGLSFTASYLHGLKAHIELFPFTNACVRNNALFKKEKGYSFKKIHKDLYPSDESNNISEHLKI